MNGTAISRRIFLAGAVSLSAPALRSALRGTAYCFATPEYDVQVTVEFYDRYATRGFSFSDLSAGRHVCLSVIGEENRNCASGFVGALAIAHYRFKPHSELSGIPGLREQVRTIDQDVRLPYRPPVDRTIELRDGVASDIQAF